MELVAAHDETRERKCVEQLVADDELRVAARDVGEVRGEIHAIPMAHSLQRSIHTPVLSRAPGLI
jgi:hypothetical protein